MAFGDDSPRDPRNPDGRVQVVATVDAGYLTLAQAAAYLGASTRTIRRRVKHGRLPHYYLPGLTGERGQLLFRKGEIDRWIRRFKNGLAEGSENALDTAGAAR